jgi:hypothetical protein
MRRRTLLAAGGALLFTPQIARADSEVDLLLVMAADVSQSMQPRDLKMQREGYAAAMQAREVLEAIASGPCGCIAAVYMEWSGTEDQRVLVPWTRLASTGDAMAFSSALAEAPQRTGDWTSIAGAIGASRRLLAAAPFRAERHVVDISGDGENNQGGAVDAQRDLAVAEGVTINGLPILRGGVQSAGGDAAEMPLVSHYRNLVIGGTGAFVLPALGFESFAGAIRRKLVLEIAGIPAPDAIRA